MSKIIDIINEEIMTSVANYPQFGDRLNSISETGEGNAGAYPFRFNNVADDEIEYTFSTEDDDYVVLITKHNDVWELLFGVVGGTTDDSINRGRIFKVMATILQITNDFINRFKPNKIQFKPVKDEEREVDNRRFNLYMQYVKKNMRPEYFVYERGDYVIIERKIKINNPRM